MDHSGAASAPHGHIAETDIGYQFYLPDKRYLGLLTYSGQLSDFRGVVIQPRVGFSAGASRDEVLRVVRTQMFALLNALLGRSSPMEPQARERYKAEQVKRMEQDFPALRRVSRFAAPSSPSATRPPLWRRGLGRLRRMAGRLRGGSPNGPAAAYPPVSAEELLASRERLRALKHRYAGRRCFIIGNGPSLNLCDLTLLQGDYSFGVNGIFYKTDEIGFSPTFYVVEDDHVVRDNIRRINALEGMLRIFPDTYGPMIRRDDNTLFVLADFGFYREGHPYHVVPRFSHDVSEVIYTGQTVTFMNMQLAFHMGFSEVYLIGMDFHYVVPKSTVIEGVNYTSRDDDPNHFHKDYFGKGKKWHDPKLDRVTMAFETGRAEFERAGRKIYNATVGGKLELFERVDYRALFPAAAGAPPGAASKVSRH